MSDSLTRLLAGRFPDPDGPGMLSVPPCRVVIEPSLAGSEAALIAPLGLGPRLAVVSDPTTRAVLGGRVEAALGSAAEPYVLPPDPHPDQATVEAVRRASASCDALIAVGSGTINDLCKYAAFLAAKPYAVFATAPSMNGYVSLSAAITVDGHKRSLPAAAPRAVFLDLAVLAAAPPRMIRAGLGDSLCRSTAEADWLFAHLVRGTPYRRAPFALLAADEAPLLAGAAALLRGERGAIERLARTLILSGFGMTICGGSYPASQGEHLISHYAEMRGRPDLPPAFHGEQIAVTTLLMARLQKRLLAAGPPALRATTTSEADLRRHFGAELGAHCWHEFSPKRLDAPAADALTQRLARDWPAITRALGAVMRPSAALAAALSAAGAPTRPSDLGWPPPFTREALRHAREIRNRYGFLDLAADSGALDPWIASEIALAASSRTG